MQTEQKSSKSGKVYPTWKKLKKSDNKDLHEAVFSWFKKLRSDNIPVNENGIKEKALSLVESVELTNFQASNGWIETWDLWLVSGTRDLSLYKHVTLQTLSREENAVKPEMTTRWNQTYLPTILKKYKLMDIYNADEFGQFYQALEDKSLHHKGECCSGGKHGKANWPD